MRNAYRENFRPHCYVMDNWVVLMGSTSVTFINRMNPTGVIVTVRKGHRSLFFETSAGRFRLSPRFVVSENDAACRFVQRTLPPALPTDAPKLSHGEVPLLDGTWRLLVAPLPSRLMRLWSRTHCAVCDLYLPHNGWVMLTTIRAVDSRADFNEQGTQSMSLLSRVNVARREGMRDQLPVYAKWGLPDE